VNPSGLAVIGPQWAVSYNLLRCWILSSGVSSLSLQKGRNFLVMMSSARGVVRAIAGLFGWNLIARGGYESAEYKVVESDGKFEVRNYPDLMLAVTKTKLEVQGRDGSFTKLFRYLSGANEGKTKIAITTRVFMENQDAGSHVQMNFFLPKVTFALKAMVPVFASTHLC
jgi:hypothetical protein